MRSGVPPPNELAADTAWHEIEAGLNELDRLIETHPAPAAFWPAFLERVVTLLGAAGGLIWRCDPERSSALSAAFHGTGNGPQVEELESLSRHALAVVGSREVHIRQPEADDRGDADLMIMSATIADEGADCVLQVLQSPQTRSLVLQGYTQIIAAARDLAEDYLRHQALETLRDREASQRALLEYVTRLQSCRGTAETAFTAANEARLIIGCDRVMVILHPLGAVKVAAVSGLDEVDSRSLALRKASQFARIAAPLGEALWSTSPPDHIPPQVADVVDAYIDETHVHHFGLIPLVDRPETPPVGMLLCEWFRDAPRDDQARTAGAIAELTASHLARAIEDDVLPLRWLARGVVRFRRQGGLARFVPAAIVVAVVVATLVFIPTDFTIEARGRLLPQRRQHVFAPDDGLVVELPPVSETPVKRGERLLRLVNPDLDLRLQELEGRHKTTREELAAAETEALRDDDADDQRPMRTSFYARVEQLKQQTAGLDRQIEVVRNQQRQLDVVSPLNGVVLTWDSQRRLAERPVNRGEVLLTVADPSGDWELDLDVPENDAGHALVAFRRTGEREVTFHTAVAPGKTFHGRLRQLAPSAHLADDGRPAVRATVGGLDLDPQLCRSGTVVVARIVCGRKPLGYVWGRRLWEIILEQFQW